jgi:hypothetical protein
MMAGNVRGKFFKVKVENEIN